MTANDVYPIAVLNDAVLTFNAFNPTAVLKDDVAFVDSAFAPIATFPAPVVFDNNASNPTAVLPVDVELFASVFAPTPVL